MKSATLDEQFRPCCSFCGFEDTETFTRTQLDVYDFACPTCPAGGYMRFRREVTGDYAHPARCATEEPSKENE